MMTVNEFIEKLKFAARSKTLYVLGCFGAPMTAANKTRYINAYTYNQNHADTINAADSDTFGFDCVCLIKGILWGWSGDASKTYGGATYTSNGVPDISADGMINACIGVSIDFSNITVGEAVWMSGHIGIYIGNGQVIECTPKWTNNVQYSWLGNLDQYKQGNYRIWTKHGKLPYIDYSSGGGSVTPTGEFKVLDVSKYQDSINYASAATSVNGVIMRIGYRGYGSAGTLSKDTKLDAHYSGFQGVTKVGFYFFTQATTAAEGIEEANYAVNIIKNWRCDFPIYIDSEYSGSSSHTGRADSLSKSARTDAVVAFCERVKQLGYRAGVYASESWFKNQLDLSRLTGYSLWVAKYSSTKPNISGYDYDGWQYTSDGTINGYSSRVDLSIFYKDVAGWSSSPVASTDVNDYELNVTVDTREFNWEYQEPEFELRGLTKGIDYNTNSLNNKNAGTILCYISGTNKYSGTRTFPWTITPRSISPLAMTLEGNFEYTGSPISPTAVRVFDQYLGNRDLTNGTDYTLSIYNNTNVGVANIDAIGKGNFTGTLHGVFTITAKNQNMSVFSLEKDVYDYTGSQITPKVLNASNLVEGRDYTVSYGPNVETSGTVTIKCFGNYNGSVTLSFSIAKSVKVYNVCDLSSYDEGTIRYSIFAANIDGVVVRAGYRGYGSSGVLVTDTKLEQFYRGLNPYTKIGFYFTTQAINETEAVNEALYVYELIKTWRCDFPIYIQTEYGNSAHTGRADDLDPATRTRNVLAFCNKLYSLGYKAGVFASDSWFANNLIASEIVSSVHSIWVDKDGETEPKSVSRYDGWLYDTTGSVAGYTGSVHKSNFYTDVANWASDKIKPDINSFDITISGTEFNYTGSQITPTVTVKNLILNTDYRVTHSNNINVGTATSFVTGINEYTGSKVINWTIKAVSLENMPITQEYKSTVYTGSALKPKITINGLTQNTDFTVSYKNNVDAGTATIIINGIGNYIGTAERTFTITPKPMENLESIFSIEYKEYKYTGLTIHPDVACSNPDMGYNEDYTITYGPNVDLGEGTVIITLKGNYTGYTILRFTISTMNIEDRDVVIAERTYVYDGKKKEPAITIDALVLNKDYQVTYLSNINAGNAKAHVEGIGQYEGVVDLDFTIMRQPIDDRGISLSGTEFWYDIDPITPTVYVDGLVRGADYRVAYTDNVEPGTATAVATGVNNYSGTLSATFVINAKSITTCIAKYGYASPKTIYRIEDGKGLRIYTDSTETKQLREGIDYNIIASGTTPYEDFNLVYFHAKGIGGFFNDIMLRFRMIDTEPSGPIDLEDDGVYNFGDIDLEDETAYGDYDFGDLLEGVDPESVADGDYDFDVMSGMYLDGYDEDDGTNIDEKGNNNLDPEPPVDDDDGVYNFGDLDEGIETAVGDYDFGDLDEGVDPATVAVEDYDFNKLAGDIEDWLVPGTEFVLDETLIFATYSVVAPFDSRSGLYYIYSGEVKNNRVRVCVKDGNVLAPAKSTGWCRVYDLAALGNIIVGDLVAVEGEIKEFPNGTGNTMKMEGNTMYVRSIADEGVQYPFGLGNGPKAAVIAYAQEGMLTKVKL